MSEFPTVHSVWCFSDIHYSSNYSAALASRSQPGASIEVKNHIIYGFLHVNVFLLAVNLLVLWQIKNRLTLIKAFMVAVAASFLAMYVSEPTMALSNFLFAQFGILLGRTGRWKKAAKKAMPFILFTMLLNNVNGLLHLYAFSIGYIIEYLFKKAARRE